MVKRQEDKYIKVSLEKKKIMIMVKDGKMRKRETRGCKQYIKKIFIKI